MLKKLRRGSFDIQYLNKVKNEIKKKLLNDTFLRNFWQHHMYIFFKDFSE